MRLKIFYFFFIRYIIFYSDFDVVEAMIGANVRNANRNEYRFAVAIVTLTNATDRIENAQRCTATLISRQDVLTAEHCVRSMNPQGFALMIGANSLTQATAYYCLYWVSYDMWAAQRPGHRQHRVNDVAIIKLTANVPRSITPALISNWTYDQMCGVTCEVIGWGILENGNHPKKLKTAEVTILERNDCQNRLRRLRNGNFNVDERRFCTAADPFILIRTGDSGGPLLYSDQVVGITHGTGPTLEGVDYHPEQINFHVSVYFYRDFIFHVLLNDRIDY